MHRRTEFDWNLFHDRPNSYVINGSYRTLSWNKNGDSGSSWAMIKLRKRLPETHQHVMIIFLRIVFTQSRKLCHRLIRII